MPAEISSHRQRPQILVSARRPPTRLVQSTSISKMKRKTDNANGQPESKKRALSNEEAVTRFNDGLFDPSLQQKYTKEYAQSAPYVRLDPL